MKPLLVADLGVVDYLLALSWQRDLHSRRLRDEIADTLLLMEHPHVYTLGRRFRREHLLAPEADLTERGIAVCEADRGGSITYHGPGQLVAYPIVDLRRPDRPQPDVIRYVRTLEEAAIKAARKVGVVARRREGLTGVWVGDSKLASVGVNISRGVTRHGLALNVSTDLSYFDYMTPCGIPEVRMTSLEQLLGDAPEPRTVKAHLSAVLARLLHRHLIPRTAKDLGLGRNSGAEILPLRAPVREEPRAKRGAL